MRKKTPSHREAVLRYSRQKGFRTRKELADDLGLHESALSRFLSGKRPLSTKGALAVSQKIGIPLESFFA